MPGHIVWSAPSDQLIARFCCSALCALSLRQCHSGGALCKYPQAESFQLALVACVKMSTGQCTRAFSCLAAAQLDRPACNGILELPGDKSSRQSPFNSLYHPVALQQTSVRASTPSATPHAPPKALPHHWRSTAPPVQSMNRSGGADLSVRSLYPWASYSDYATKTLSARCRAGCWVVVTSIGT